MKGIESGSFEERERTFDGNALIIIVVGDAFGGGGGSDAIEPEAGRPRILAARHLKRADASRITIAPPDLNLVTW